MLSSGARPASAALFARETSGPQFASPPRVGGIKLDSGNPRRPQPLPAPLAAKLAQSALSHRSLAAVQGHRGPRKAPMHRLARLAQTLGQHSYQGPEAVSFASQGLRGNHPPRPLRKRLPSAARRCLPGSTADRDDPATRPRAPGL